MRAWLLAIVILPGFWCDTEQKKLVPSIYYCRHESNGTEEVLQLNTNATFKYFYFNTAGGTTSTGRYRLIGDTLVLTHSKSKKEELVIKVTERLTSSPTVKLKFKVWQSGSKRPYPGAVFQLNKGYHGVTSDRTGEASVQVNTTMGDTMQICIKGYNIIRYPVQPKKDVEFGIEVDFLRYFNEGGDEFIPIIEARQNRITMNRGGVRFVFDRIDEGKLGELYKFLRKSR